MRDIRFEPFDNLKEAPDLVNYFKTYTAPLDTSKTLETIFADFNIDRPEDFTGRSLSVSDVVVMNRDGKETAFYVDSIGFKELPGFLAGKEPKDIQTIDLKAVADYLKKQHDYASGADPTKQTAGATVNIITRRLEQANERIPAKHPQLKALLTHAAQSPDLPTLKERMNTLHSEFTQHYSTAVQITVDMSGKAEPPTAAVSAQQTDPAQSPQPQRPPAQGENVAAIEAKVKAGETINLSDLSDAIKKDKQAAQGEKTQTSKSGARTAAKKGAWKAAQAQDSWDRAQGKPTGQKQPSIKEQLTANKKQIAGQKSAPPKTVAKNINAGLGD
jgi:hypothetical protein